ncbi:hypothetical protein Zm00014a_016501 [Zea mays]|uniref:Uncharacterized protein n=1 Tax=Zea mays TaxID=4577 RepID=A0A3L6DKM9_MAIZE|nr:hypothetical protein Zm00014a_016501 [Zea mays]
MICFLCDCDRLIDLFLRFPRSYI